MNIEPAEPRCQVTDDEYGGFRVTIRPRGFGVLSYVGLCVLITAVILGTLKCLNEGSNVAVTAAAVAFLVLTGLLLGMLIVFRATCFEIVMIDGKTLEIRSEWAFGAFSETFGLGEIRNLRVVCPTAENEVTLQYAAFDRGRMVHRFASGLSTHELSRLVKTILVRFPIKNDQDDIKPLPVNP